MSGGYHVSQAGARCARRGQGLGWGVHKISSLFTLVVICGCSANVKTVEKGPKEVYVEAQRVDVAVNLLRYPLDPKSEGRAYVAIRDFATGRGEVRQKLGTLLGQQPAPKDHEAAEALDEEEPFELDLSAFPPRDPPTLLFFPDTADLRANSACYIGHSAYARSIYSPSRAFLHHVRLLVVNREASTVRVPLGDVTLERPSSMSADARDAVAGSARTLAALAGHSGGRISTLVVPPRSARLAHLFFYDSGLPASLLVSWRANLDVQQGEPTDTPQSWLFQTTLLRRYVLQEGELSDLELKVGRGDELPKERRALEPWQEPKLAAIVGAPPPGPPSSGK